MSESRIVAFAKDWDDVPTCTTHILREMGRTRPVLWVNSIGTRKPSLIPRDLRRALRRLPSAFARARPAENRLRVLAPLLVPKAVSPFARALNRRVLGALMARELREMGGGPIEYWCFVPNAVDVLPVRMAAAKVIYYCVDDWSKFENLDSAWIGDKESRLVQRADVVFAVSAYLMDKCRALLGPRAEGRLHDMPHGVEHAKFADALSPSCVAPPDVRDLRQPIIGFYGNIRAWIDFDLLEQLARSRPDWTFVMIGEVFTDVSRLRATPNVRFLGRREHDELPRYCKAVSAAVIPYDLRDPRMESVNPVKTRELLAAGVPIVASDVPELRELAPDVLIRSDLPGWLTALEQQIHRQDRREISERRRADDWTLKVRDIRRIVDTVTSS